MKIYRTDKNILWASEVKSWLCTLVTITVFYLGLKSICQITNEKLFIGIVVLLLLKLGDRLRQYHVTEIEVDEEKDKLTFRLNSMLSGKKIKQYNLQDATSDLITSFELKKYFGSQYTLKIHLKPKDIFSLNNRYGFSNETLILIDRIFKKK